VSPFFGPVKYILYIINIIHWPEKGGQQKSKFQKPKKKLGLLPGVLGDFWT
jgi:hypothetical protein